MRGSAVDCAGAIGNTKTSAAVTVAAPVSSPPRADPRTRISMG